MKKLFIILSVFYLSAALALPAFTQRLNPGGSNEVPQITEEFLLRNFYKKKAEAALKGNTTFRARYNAVALYAYPRTYWEDTLPAHPSYLKQGALYSKSLQDTYLNLLSTRPDAQAAAQTALGEIILNPRRVNVAKSTPMPKAGDIWHSAFYIASYYVQLQDFSETLRDQDLRYKDYLKYLQTNNTFMAAGYNEDDYALIKAGYKKEVFDTRLREIENFITSYTNSSNKFIREFLAPLQTSKIDNADVQAYLEANVPHRGLPEGVSRRALIEVIMQQIAPAQAYYDQAEHVNPSFGSQLNSAGKVLGAGRGSAPWAYEGPTWNDVGNMLSMFEYIMPSTLMQHLGNYGKIPDRETVINDLAGTFAAEALNKSLAQIANDLFEFEKPFYYSYFSFNGKEDAIGAHWHAIATNSFYYDGAIAKIAYDNIAFSGRKMYQDNKLIASSTKRRITENTEFYAKAIPIATDFAAGDVVFLMASPLFKGAKHIASAAKANPKTALVGLRFDNEAYQVLKGGAKLGQSSADDVARVARASASVSDDAARVGKAAASISDDAAKGAASVAYTADNMMDAAFNTGKRMSSVRKANHISLGDGWERAVWELKNAQGETVGFLKYTNIAEIERTQQLADVMYYKGIAKKFNLLDIEYSQVAVKGMGDIPKDVRASIRMDYDRIAHSVRGGTKRANTPFVTNPIDTRGFTLDDLVHARLKPEMKAEYLKVLNNKRITPEEWAQIKSFYETLNSEGFVHTDVIKNLHISRSPDGKLKLSILDFEHTGHKTDLDILETLETNLNWGDLKESTASMFRLHK